MRQFDMSRDFHPRAQLSPHFMLAELTRSETAIKHGLYNIPRDVAELANLKALAERVLEPARQFLGCPLVVTSGYRCPTLNRLIGGAKASQHMFGEAADFVPKGMAVEAAAFTLAALDTLPFDQLIYEVRERAGKPPMEWIHMSHKRIITNRHEVLTIHKRTDGTSETFAGIQPVLEPMVRAAE